MHCIDGVKAITTLLAIFFIGHLTTAECSIVRPANECFHRAKKIMPIKDANTLCYNSQKPHAQLMCWHSAKNLFDRKESEKAAYLCQRTERPSVPSLCYKKLENNLGQNIKLKICQGISNLTKTFNCMKKNIKSGATVGTAINRCERFKNNSTF